MTSGEPSPSATQKDPEIDTLCGGKEQAKALANVHELDVFACPRCLKSRMWVIAVIIDPVQLDAHPTGRG